MIAPLTDIVLDRVSRQDAGSASGVFNTGLQLGQLDRHRAGRSDLLRPARQPVRARGHRGSAPAADRAGGRGRASAVHRSDRDPVPQLCLHDRLVAADPTATPASCRPAGAAQTLPPAAHQVIAAAGGNAVRHDFAAALVRTLWFQVGVFLLSFLLMLGLPRRAAGAAPRS